ncbi:hypothetical protein SOV_50570 [Sporomusa ovata DSM 2662]|uniref:CD-NTase associated protein 4-like DNA endonuclease domain-containing protein n=1 Tax=Sporomusa ovata TaxID=2378 RepID=A0A0U1L164_9FIRM|nr:hypothetical protein [Sporomusa ovata]EQB27430.1 hypothetical protein SOV_2c03260 [Sporomusa ovata DSM 2662]CQR73275.1 hypothetical protein SpAn4DRAFT_2507 [Sporomusa ovata]
MSYTIQSTEKTKSKGSEFETKALLYLMSFRYSSKAWDLQSKAAKKNHQTAIGKELVTLFKNYSSNFHFDFYILFLGGVADSVRVDNNKNIFDISDITLNSQTKIQNALIKECKSKTYIENSKVTRENIEDFLNKVIFVIDDKEKSEYIKSIVKVNPRIIPPKTVLDQIFNQIRDVQSSKKNNGSVEGITINAKEEFIYYNRHLTTQEIRMMVLSRIVNNNLMQKGITPSFIPIYCKLPDTEQKDILEDCQLNIAKTLFDKNNTENFWDLFNNIYEVVTSNESLSIDTAYKLLNMDILHKLNYLDMLSVKYFMALIKDGIYEN